ncbi:MAG: T9SS type A sorting domain-containing protein [FCB group bacterium]|nr:T9SS type A sorting domain-containing protein [FCB group bacterium]
MTGIVTADTAQYNSWYKAYAIQSESAPWNGIIFDGWDDSQLTRGDEVTITGLVEEFDPAQHFKWDNNTKIINVSSVTVNSTGNSIEPMVVSTADLAQDAEEVESYEGCLVRLTNVTVSSVNSYDWSVVDDSGIECLIDDDMATPAAGNFMGDLQVGNTLETVTGILNFSFGTYKIQIRDMADLGQLSTDDDFSIIPHKFALYQNYPNPFNPETRIRFELASRQNVKLVVYNLLGHKVRTLTNEVYNPGYHVLNWDGRNDANRQVSSGIYIYRIKAGDFVDHKKMILLR